MSVEELDDSYGGGVYDTYVVNDDPNENPIWGRRYSGGKRRRGQEVLAKVKKGVAYTGAAIGTGIALLNMAEVLFPGTKAFLAKKAGEGIGWVIGKVTGRGGGGQEKVVTTPEGSYTAVDTGEIFSQKEFTPAKRSKNDPLL